MSRKIAILLAFALTLTMAIPAGGFAATMDKALENAIKIAKTKFEIPDDYKFSSGISTENGRNIFNLSWRSADTSNPASINVRIDEKGTIIGYDRYSQDDYVQAKKLPKLSRQEAKTRADSYIKQIEPGLLDKLKCENNYQGNVADACYYFTYYRVENGLPYNSDMVSVTLNRDTGALMNYSRQITDGLAFPAAAGVISADAARQAYIKNMGLRMIYKYSYTDEVLKAYAVYTPVYDNGGFAINAFTGERQRIANDYYGGYYSNGMAATQAMRKEGKADVKLSPDELKAVQNAAKLMSQDDAEKIARNAKFLGLSSDMKLQSYSLDEYWPARGEYAWNLQFVKPAGDKAAYDEYVGVAVNAGTGEITSFYRGGARPLDAAAKPKGDINAAKESVDGLLREYYPQYYRQVTYDKIASESYINGKTDTFYTLIYSRMVNGTAFPDNGINVSYDNISGTITGFTLTWFNIPFPSPDKVIGAAVAYDKLFRNVGLKLEYKKEYMDDPEHVKIGYTPENTKVALVYALNPGKPLLIDANTGNLLNNDGSVFKEPARASYTDIKGNAAEKQIMVLADNGISLDGTEFKPNSPIIQKDFLTLLSKTLSYYGPTITAKSSGKDIDEMYSFLQREGIVKAGEKAPQAAVTREDAVKFIIRALKYDKVADIKGIYSISYKDKANISPNLEGYVAIASGLGIVDAKSAYFNPKAKLTRGESAIMIYNYLQS